MGEISPSCTKCYGYTLHQRRIFPTECEHCSTRCQLVMLMSSPSATPSAVPWAVTRVRKASRVLEDLNAIEHNEARRVRRTKKPVALSTSTSYEVLRETTEVADLLPLPIRVAAGSAQVRPPPPASTHVIGMHPG